MRILTPTAYKPLLFSIVLASLGLSAQAEAQGRAGAAATRPTSQRGVTASRTGAAKSAKLRESRKSAPPRALRRSQTSQKPRKIAELWRSREGAMSSKLSPLQAKVFRALDSSKGKSLETISKDLKMSVETLQGHVKAGYKRLPIDFFVEFQFLEHGGNAKALPKVRLLLNGEFRVLDMLRKMDAEPFVPSSKRTSVAKRLGMTEALYKQHTQGLLSKFGAAATSELLIQAWGE